MKLDDLYAVQQLDPQKEIESFNVENHIMRENIKEKLRKELEEMRQNQKNELLAVKEIKPIYYYYKRWIWM